MEYFDIVDMKGGVDPKLTSRLGFARILAMGNDLSVTNGQSRQGEPSIVRSRDEGVLMRAIRDSNAVALEFAECKPMSKVIAAAREAGKPIVVTLNPLFVKGKEERYRNIARAKALARAITKARATPLIITGAQSPDYLLSTAQMLSVAEFIGISRGTAAAALSKTGEYFDR